MKLRIIIRLVPIVIMTITQSDSFYVERFHDDHTAACNDEIRISRSYTEISHKTFYIASDTHDEIVLAGKY